MGKIKSEQTPAPVEERNILAGATNRNPEIDPNDPDVQQVIEKLKAQGVLPKHYQIGDETFSGRINNGLSNAFSHPVENTKRELWKSGAVIEQFFDGLNKQIDNTTFPWETPAPPFVPPEKKQQR